MFLRGLTLSRLYRRTLRTLERIDLHLAEQNRILARIANHFAPELSADAPAGAAVDYLNPQEAFVVLDYTERVQREQGRLPTEDEVLRYLADQATVDLQARMEQQL